MRHYLVPNHFMCQNFVSTTFHVPTLGFQNTLILFRFQITFCVTILFQIIRMLLPLLKII